MIDEFYLIVLPFTKVKQYAFFRYREQYDLLYRCVLIRNSKYGMLKAHKLFNQLSFHTVTVALLLNFFDCIDVWLRISEVKIGESCKVRLFFAFT